MKKLLLSLTLLVPTSMHAQYRITQRYPVGGEGSWDYLVPDTAHHRIFIGRQDRVMVIDGNDGRLLGEVKGIHGAHGTAIDLASGHGFATSGDDSSIVMFDLNSYAVLGRTHAAEDADAIIFDESSHRVFSFNGDAHSATVVEPVGGTLVTNIPLGGKPEYGVSAGDGMVYANLTDVSEVVEIDATRLQVTRRWSTGVCKQPVAMGIDRVHRRLFSGCRSGVMAVSDIARGAVIATVPIGAGTDGAAYDPATGDAFASNLDGTLTVIHQDTPDSYHVAQTLETAINSRNLGLDLVTHRVFLAAAKFGPVPVQATRDNPRRRAPMLPSTFEVLVVQRP